MKAIVFDNPGNEDVLKIGEAPAPEMIPGGLRVRVRATAVNRADLLQRQGLYPPPPGASPILGLECAGEVIEVGDGVAGWNKGDRTMALLAGGGYAEEVVVHHGSAMRVPASLTFEEAGALPEVFLTAYLNLFMLGGARAGSWALVHGGGSGVGTAAIQLLKEAGLKTIITAGSPEKCERCIELGATAAINYREGDFAAKVRETADGRGVDVVLDHVGGKYLAGNIDCLAVDGRLVIIGLIGGARSEINLASLLLKRLHVIGSTLRTRSVESKAEIVSAFTKQFGDAIASGRVKPIVDRVFPLAKAADAHRLVQASEHFGKVVLAV